MTKRQTYRTRAFENEAAFCRKHRLFPGTLLIGDEGYGATVVLVTALGESYLLARCVAHGGELTDDREGVWTLAARDWERLPRAEFEAMVAAS